MPKVVNWLAVPAAPTVVAEQPTSAVEVDGTVAYVDDAARAEHAPTLVSATWTKTWKPAVYFTTGAIRIGSGNTSKQFVAFGAVFSQVATVRIAAWSSKLYHQ